MLAKAPIVIYNSFKLGPALGDSGKFNLLFTVTQQCIVQRYYVNVLQCVVFMDLLVV